MAMAVVFLIVSLLAAPTVYAVDYVVGDNSGWTQSVNYASWASGKTFTVGDNLVFNYGSSHSVDEVSKSDYDSCITGNALSSYNGGSNTIPLKNAGSIYFICPSFGHCGGGMKLGVTVVAASTTPTTPTTPSPPSGSTPSPPSGSTPPGADTPPETPRQDTPPPPPPKSSGAAGSFSNMSQLVLGISIILASVFAFMG